MSTNVISINPIRCRSFEIDAPATIEHIDTSCEVMYLEWRFSPAFVLMTQPDYDVLLNDINERAEFSIREDVPGIPIELLRVTRILNKTTQVQMDVFVSASLTKRMVVFGRVDDL